MDSNNAHPIYKIVAVIVVGSVAKALFSPNRPVSPVASQVASTATHTAEKLVDATVGKRG